MWMKLRALFFSAASARNSDNNSEGNVSCLLICKDALHPFPLPSPCLSGSPFPFPLSFVNCIDRKIIKLFVSSRECEREGAVERKSCISLSPSLAVGHSVSSSSFFLTFFPFIPEILARAYSIFVCVAQFDFPLHDYNPFSLYLFLSWVFSFEFPPQKLFIIMENCSISWQAVNRICLSQTQSEMLRRRVFPNEDQELPCEHDRKSSSIRVVGVCTYSSECIPVCVCVVCLRKLEQVQAVWVALNVKTYVLFNLFYFCGRQRAWLNLKILVIYLEM